MQTPNETLKGIPTRYPDARFVVSVLDLVGVLIGIIGVIWFGWSVFNTVKQGLLMSAGDQGSPMSLLSFASLLPSLAMVIGGILIFAHGQLLRASLDTADLTRELYVLTKDQRERG